LLHAQKLCENAKEIGYSNSKLLQLKACMFQCFMSGTRDFEAAKSIREEIEADLQAGIMLPSYYEALFKYNKGFLEAIFAHYDEAIQYMKEGLALYETSEKYPGEHKNEVLCALTNLMQYYVMRGETEKAEALIPRGEEMFQNSKSLVSNCTFIYVLALVLLDEGKFQEAEKVLDKTEDYPTLGTERPPIYHGILIQKVTALVKQEKFTEALRVLEECDKKIEAFFQGRNNTSLSHILLLKSFIAMGKNQASSEILQNLEKALLAYNNFFKAEKKQRRQANTYFAMGKAYALKKDFEKALEHYLTSDEIYTNVLKSKKIDDVSELYTGLALLGIDMKQEKITSMYLKAHMETFGVDHPRTNEIISVLDDKGLGIPF